MLIFLIEGDTFPFVVFLNMKSPLDFKSTTQAEDVVDGLRNVLWESTVRSSLISRVYSSFTSQTTAALYAIMKTVVMKNENCLDERATPHSTIHSLSFGYPETTMT